MKIHVFAVAPALAAALACSSMGGGRTARSDTSGASATGSSASAEAPGSHAGDIMVEGRVADASGSHLTIETSDGTTRSLAIVEQTIVTVDGRDGRATDLTPGQDIRASYHEVDGRPTAVRVDVANSGAGRHQDDAGSRGTQGAQPYGTTPAPDPQTGTGSSTTTKP